MKNMFSLSEDQQRNLAVGIHLAYRQIDAVQDLFEEYVQSLNVDLSFQNYAEEVRQLPGAYAMPQGRLYIAYCGDNPAGCIALKRQNDDSCEMKRLYVRPAFRGLKIGQTLAETVIADAREIGYKKIYLDTLDFLKRAIFLYEKLGFVETSSYYQNPLACVRYFQLDLRDISIAKKSKASG